MSRLVKAKRCPGPRCLAQIDPQKFCCDTCWAEIPGHLRERVNQGMDVRPRDRGLVHALALRAVVEHWRRRNGAHG